jgi:hypothetical protein
MDNKLHISNGASLTNRLQDLEINDPILSWEEMFCEGPTTYNIITRELFKLRRDYLSKTYDLEINLKAYNQEISKLNNFEQYDEIILWFEYDLFCHINLLAVINLLEQLKIKKPLYLVCSGRLKGEADLKALAELSDSQLKKHYKNKVLLSQKDIELAKTLWGIYCGKDHNLFKSFIVKKSSFEYLGNCLKAHLMRFPDSKTGLGTLENNILMILNKFEIKSKNHLLGYALNYQGYYGYGDLQFERIFNNLRLFIDETEKGLKLNDLGNNIIIGKVNALPYTKNNVTYGGLSRTDFFFDKAQNKFIKSNL